MKNIGNSSADGELVDGSSLGEPSENSTSADRTAGQPSLRSSLRQLLTLVVVAAVIVAAIWGLESRLSPGDESFLSIGASSDSQEASPRVGHAAPDFALRDLDGTVVRLSSLRGKRVVINFWASWCPPCRAEMPDLEALYKENRSDGVVVLGINLGESRETVAEFARAQGTTFPILLDPDSEASLLYQPNYLPTTYFVDGDGVIREIHVGAMNKATMQFKLSRAK